MQRIAVYPGTFDPITNGHVDVIERASQMFDKIIVVIAVNSKKEVLFSDEERCELAVQSLKQLPNVEVEMHKGLIIEFARSKNAVALIRGIRAVSDFEYEFQLALMNRKLVPEIKTIFLMPHERYTYLNSSIIRELAKYKQDVSEFVPDVVYKKLKEKFKY
ncbi:MAG: pantetheine-phosphate adenylyltransferase [Ignavibacteria bacterium GWB2_35_12]|nr:MAG: pantetheine-phosphate adenylyltransferase [Ignavibacteria bacterium GWA2_35_8]OGU41532.1 MAG: pantetheine-phosphate adenylyltransferase [Ignavibacteria bacterium GWB2_35_12]OGU93018.1 MAG: pantetheine-phosphate adenylyltransferase [Ignavibacteria bacterium RIFOXYA2_FULL_35_10]OGV23006.1 MAG: pantetheine-phosphate adenylyltransferase [Ignavibacteria bacterium RIFOXYC2_FULL_35_21]